ncbi:MAG: F0F1 ATP synthase subunit epsilon [Candidatus Latescibacteria bacterium]|jgi:F-type H+-transporting ATPase subunit epsilon|nr:F0F1 ATP synthase subunit epsilon [Candidatus Latescibacterota bacterium]
MAEKTFHFEIITPEKVLLSEEIDSLEAPGVDGEFQIFADHTPFLTGLDAGQVTCTHRNQKKYISVSGGFCEVMPDKSVILAQTAELANEIDKKRAESARDRAKKRMEAKDDPSIDSERARMALLRALTRLRVADIK